MPIARIVAREQQADGYLKSGKIVSVRRLTTDEFMDGLELEKGNQAPRKHLGTC